MPRHIAVHPSMASCMHTQIQAERKISSSILLTCALCWHGAMHLKVRYSLPSSIGKCCHDRALQRGF